MKKTFIKSIICSIFTVLILSVLVSCEVTESIVINPRYQPYSTEQDVDTKLNEISSLIQSTNFQDYVYSNEIINKKLYNALLDTTLLLEMAKPQKAPRESQITFTNNEEKVIKNYLSDINSNPEINPIAVASLYLDEIDNIKLSSNEKSNLTNLISNNKDLFVFVKADLIEEKEVDKNIPIDNGGNGYQVGCRFRDCMDCCMYVHSKSLGNMNWIEWAIWLASAAENVAGWFVSCTWDCAFNPSKYQ